MSRVSRVEIKLCLLLANMKEHIELSMSESFELIWTKEKVEKSIPRSKND